MNIKQNMVVPDLEKDFWNAIDRGFSTYTVITWGENYHM
jgi:hypothetical protein